MAGSGVATSRVVVPLHAEDVAVVRRRLETVVRVTRSTVSERRVLEEDCVDERVEIERVPIGRSITEVPPVRQEGAVTIVPVVEEVVVTERRLVLKEEVHLRRVTERRRHSETVVLRRQEAVVTRFPVPET